MRNLKRTEWRLHGCCSLAVFLVGGLASPIHAEYDENTSRAPKEEVITDGGIRMEIGKTIRLTPAPISAWHPWLKAIRLDNGDLIFNCPLSGGQHRDYALSPKEDDDLCSLRSKDNGATWRRSVSQTTEDGGANWSLRPTAVQRAVRLKDGSLLANYGRNLGISLTPTADKQTIFKRVDPMSFGYAPTMTQLSDGRILCAAQQGFATKMQRLGEDKSQNPRNPDTDEPLSGGFYIQFWISADRGVHWQEAGKLSCQTLGQNMSQGFESYAEPFFLKTANGDLLMFLRTGIMDSTGGKTGPKRPPVKVVRSTDEGRTWSKPMEVHPTGVMPVATLLDNGIIVAFTGRGGNRVAASRDHGLTWYCHHNLMSTGQSPNFSGHNAIVPVSASRALLIYTENHSHPDNSHREQGGPAPTNRYGAELIGTFVTFQPVSDTRVSDSGIKGADKTSAQRTAGDHRLEKPVEVHTRPPRPAPTWCGESSRGTGR